MQFCLHSALLESNTLIISGVQSVDKSQKYMHYHLHLSALIYTCLHSSTLVCTHLHLSALICTCLHSSALVCTARANIHVAREGEFSVTRGRIYIRTDKFVAPPMSFERHGITRLHCSWRLAAKSADKCNACRQWCILSTPPSTRITYW